MSTITRPTDWWIYTPEYGFNRIGGCSEEHVEKAIGWQEEVEYEHTENMRHDAERD